MTCLVQSTANTLLCAADGFVCSEKLDYDGHPIYSGNATNPLTNTLEGCAVVAAANCNFPGAFFVFKKTGECLIRTDFPVETFKDVQYGDQQGYGVRTGPDDDVAAACVCTFGYINKMSL